MYKHLSLLLRSKNTYIIIKLRLLRVHLSFAVLSKEQTISNIQADFKLIILSVVTLAKAINHTKNKPYLYILPTLL